MFASWNPYCNIQTVKSPGLVEIHTNHNRTSPHFQCPDQGLSCFAKWDTRSGIFLGGSQPSFCRFRSQEKWWSFLKISQSQKDILLQKNRVGTRWGEPPRRILFADSPKVSVQKHSPKNLQETRKIFGGNGYTVSCTEFVQPLNRSIEIPH